MGVKSAVLNVVTDSPGLTARQITDILYGEGANQGPILVICRTLEYEGQIRRSKRYDGKTGNYVNTDNHHCDLGDSAFCIEDISLSEEDMYHALFEHLEKDGWRVNISYRRYHGREVVGIKEDRKWIIVVSGTGSYMSLRTKHFAVCLGELLMHTDEDNAKYSVVLPRTSEFLKVWKKFPTLARSRTGISALFIDMDGCIEEMY